MAILLLTDSATIMNGIGQGSFAAALASSIKLGSAVHEITKGEVTANIGNILNSLIFQDDIAKMNYMLEDARKGGRDIGRFGANTSKSKFVILAPQKSKTALLKEAG